ncbi:YIP1 family protein [Candidatus Gottesmanbacteria bacterium]|nr:YIP1 family protein [Candidatus Gottesmanbacteria bacterium]
MMLDALLIAGVSFGRNAVGLVVRPYETYRRIVDRGSPWELVYVAVLAAAYFALASLVKVASFRPFLLTRQFVVLGAAAGLTYVGVIGVIWVIGKMVGGKGTFRGVAIAWGYTILPTIAWFFTTSILYVLLPPPRTTSVAGIAFSVFFLIFSAALFFWKVTLGYLALRFGLKLDLVRILMVVGVVGPMVGAWSWGMYRLGIFKVPFL